MLALCKMFKTFEPPHDKTNKMTVHPVKTQISLGIHPVWSVSSLCAQWVAKDPVFLHPTAKTDQTGRMHPPSLIWVFAGHTCHLVGFVMWQLIMCLLIKPSIVWAVWTVTLKTWSWKTPKSGQKKRKENVSKVLKCQPFFRLFRDHQLSLCHVADVKCLPVPWYSVVFTFSDGLKAEFCLTQCYYRSMRDVAFFNVCYEQTQSNRVYCLKLCMFSVFA